jgi:hypothetical protein
MWNKLLIISILIIIICPVLSQVYYFSKYEDQTIVHGDVVGGLEFRGKNTIMVKDLWNWYATHWVVHVDGLVNFSFQKGGVPYNLKYYNCTNLTLAPPGEKPGQWNFDSDVLSYLSGNVTFNEMQTYNDAARPKNGYSIDGLILKGVTGELSSTLKTGGMLRMESVRVNFNNQSIIPPSRLVGDDLIRFYSKGVIRVKATISNNGTLWVPLEKIVWEPLNGQLKITDFSGTAVQSGKIFFGDVTIDGKDITIQTIQNPYPDNNDPEYPAHYWNIEVTFTDGHLSGYYYPYWGMGAIIGVVVITVLDVTGYIYWAIKKKKQRKEK